MNEAQQQRLTHQDEDHRQHWNVSSNPAQQDIYKAR